MPVSRMDLRSAEHGLRSIERLIESGDASVAAVALDLIAPAIGTSVDEEQAARLRTASEAIARSRESSVHDVPGSGVVVPFSER